MRPVFSTALRADADAFFAALQRALQDPAAPCRGMLYGERDGRGAILRRHERDQHFWSPALHLHLDEDDGAPSLHGRFSPSSPVWTAFLAIYLTLTIVAVACACYGGAQMILDEPPWAFVGVPIAVALFAFTYGAAFIGQGLGSEDMYALRAFVDAVNAARPQVAERDERAG